MKILGLNCYHSDSSASLVINGRIVAATEEERFVRVKHYRGFPLLSIKYCLNRAKISINDVDLIALNYNPYYNFKEKVNFFCKNIINSNFLLLKLNKVKILLDIKKDLYNFYGLTKKIKVIYVPHHLSHIASSVLCSGFSSGLAISWDGSGDFSTTEIYNVNDNKFNLVNKINFPHSLGIFYQAITQYLGFKEYGDEYKVMGLVAHGKPRYRRQMEDIIKFHNGKFLLNLKYFQHHKSAGEFDISTYKSNNLYSKHLVKILGEERKEKDSVLTKHRDIAASLQFVFEDISLKLIKYYKKKNNSKTLFLSGGCAFNALCNMKILQNLEFKNFFIQPNAGDAGGGLGAALYLSSIHDKQFTNRRLKNNYFGINENKNEIKKNLDNFFLNNKKFIYKKFISLDLLCRFVALKISKNKIVAWHQGRAEFGPRALGNRSILANPSFLKIKRDINKKIKFREPFRPFSPSVIDKYASNYFDLTNSFQYLYMNATCNVKKNIRKKIMAVVNKDYTARVQVVTKSFNKIYYQLLNHFYKITKIPILLNTSLNIQEPICNTSYDSIKTFLNSKIDILVIENFIIIRR